MMTAMTAIYRTWCTKYLDLGYTPIPLSKATKHPSVKYKYFDETNSGWSKELAKAYTFTSEDDFGLAVIDEDNYIVWDIDGEPDKWRAFFEGEFECFKNAPLEATYHDKGKTQLKGYHFYIQDNEVFTGGTRVLMDNERKILPIDTRKTWEGKTAGIVKCFPSPKRKWIRPIVHISELPPPDEKFLEYYNTHKKTTIKTSKANTGRQVEREKKTNDRLKPLNDSAITDLLNVISDKWWDEYDSWFGLGSAIKNIGMDLNTFHHYSKKSSKYDSNTVNTYWNERVGEYNCQLGTICHYAKESDPKQFQKAYEHFIFAEQRSEYSKSFQSGSITNNMIAKLYYEGHRDIYRFSKGQWYQFNKYGIYKPLKFDVNVVLSREIIKYVQQLTLKLLKNTTEDDKRKKLWKVCSTIESNKFKRDTIEELKQFYLDEELDEKLDSKTNLVGFNNGVLNLNTMEFAKGEPEDYISMTVGYNYESCSEEKIMECEELIGSLFETEEVARFVLKLVACFLEGANREEMVYIHNGNGRNGKGTLDTLLQRAMGEYYQDLDVSYYIDQKKGSCAQPELVKLKNKRLVMTTEPEGEHTFLTSKFKKISGGDLITCRELYSNDVMSFRPTFKPNIQTNHLPKYTDVDDGLLQRQCVINYPFKFLKPNEIDINNKYHKRADPHLKEKITAIQIPFINMLIKWYSIYKAEGLVPPKSIMENTKEYRKDIDSVTTFIQDRLERVDAGSSYNESYINVYHAYCESNNDKVSRLVFLQRAKSNYDIRKAGGRKINCFIGYRLKDVENDSSCDEE